MGTESLDSKIWALRQQINGAAAFISLGVFFVVLNLLALRIQTKQRDFSSYHHRILVPALVVFLFMCAFAIADAKAYMAYYLTEDRAVQEKSVVRISQYDYVISVLYPIASTLPKLSVCTLYLRIFKVKRGLYRLTCGVIAFLIGNAIAWLIPTIFVCSPIRTFWSHRGASGKCLNWPIFGTWISLPNIVSDLLILVLPMRTLWRTQMKPAKKLGLMVTFATGSIGMIGACLRLSSYIHVTYIQQPGKDQSTASIAFNVVFTYIECGMYLLAACLPTLHPLLVQLHQVANRVVSKLSSILQRRPVSDLDGLDQQPKKGRGFENENFNERRMVEVSLTGAGNLDTLLQEGEDVGCTRAEGIGSSSNADRSEVF